jgi:hypothetical protein
VRAIYNTSVWLQAGQYLALAAQIPAKQKSGCPPLCVVSGTVSVVGCPVVSCLVYHPMYLGLGRVYLVSGIDMYIGIHCALCVVHVRIRTFFPRYFVHFVVGAIGAAAAAAPRPPPTPTSTEVRWRWHGIPRDSEWRWGLRQLIHVEREMGDERIAY